MLRTRIARVLAATVITSTTVVATTSAQHADNPGVSAESAGFQNNAQLYLPLALSRSTPRESLPIETLTGEIAFETLQGGRTNIAILRLAEQRLKILSGADGNDMQPAWSADGGSLSFATDRDGNSEIYSMSADGGNLQRLTDDTSYDGEPTWSPRGDAVAFHSDRDGGGKLLRLSLTTRDSSVIESASRWSYGPKWSPDGHSIAFVSIGAEGDQIYTANIISGDARCVTCALGLSAAAMPSWSPDGKSIAFHARKAYGFGVFIVSIDGSDLRTLIDSPANEAEPSWSPDGRHIALQSDQDGDYEIYAIDVTGSNLIQLTRNSTHDTNPDWGRSVVIPSPDQEHTNGDPIHRRIYVLVYDPVLDGGLTGGKKLSEYMGWQPWLEQSADLFEFFRHVSDGRVTHELVKSQEINGWPRKVDGFSYGDTLEGQRYYLDVLAGRAQPHQPDTADYYQWLNDPALDICGALNRGEIDELWMYAGYWLGFYESALATSPDGPHGFWYNGPTYDKTSCSKLMPIMSHGNSSNDGNGGPHAHGHRAESTMTFVYGDWQQNRMDHNWDRFALEGAHSPDHAQRGCGSVHYAPNARTDDDAYIYSLGNEALSTCADFQNYPELGKPEEVAKPVTCRDWGCSPGGYETWWWSHLPHFAGTGNDGILNDWWQYIMDPNKALPTAGEFSDLSASLLDESASFQFKYTGRSPSYTVQMSTLPDMSWDVHVDFAAGTRSPLVNAAPASWGKYLCGATLYWRVIAGSGLAESSIQSSNVRCQPTTRPSANSSS